MVTVPAAGEEISAATFGIPVATQMNALYPHEIAYNQITASITLTATTAATANTVVSSPAITYDGSVIVIEFFSPAVSLPSAQILLHLWDGATDLGYLSSTVSGTHPVCAKRRLAPSAGSHTYMIKGWSTTGTGVVNAGVGGSSTVYNPSYLRICKGV